MSELDTQVPEKQKPINPEMEERVYRADPAISNSDCSLMLSSPKAFKGVKDGELEGFTSTGFKMGTALDIMILTPHIWESDFILEPADMEKPSSPNQMGFVADIIAGKKASDAILDNYKADKKTEEAIAKMAFENIEKFEVFIEFQKKIISGKKSYSAKEKADLLTMKSAIDEHKFAGTILMGELDGFRGFSQVAIFWKMLEVNCKGLLDRLLINKEEKIIKYYDLKWTGKGVGYFEDSIRRYRYYRQLAYYRKGLQTIFPSFTIEAYLIAVTPTWGGECRILELPEAYYEEGEREFTELLKAYKWHQDTNQFEYRKEYYENNGIEVVSYVTS